MVWGLGEDLLRTSFVLMSTVWLNIRRQLKGFDWSKCFECSTYLGLASYYDDTHTEHKSDIPHSMSHLVAKQLSSARHQCQELPIPPRASVCSDSCKSTSVTGQWMIESWAERPMSIFSGHELFSTNPHGYETGIGYKREICEYQHVSRPEADEACFLDVKSVRLANHRLFDASHDLSQHPISILETF